MYATNLDIMAKVLLPPVEKLRKKGLRDIRERVITVKDVLGKVPSRDEIVEALIKGFKRALGAEVYFDEYKEIELVKAEELLPKYKSREWIFKR